MEAGCRGAQGQGKGERVIGVILAAAADFTIPPLCALATGCLSRPRRTRQQFLLTWASFGAVDAALTAAAIPPGRYWLYPASFGASALLALVLWWLSRRKGKRKALKALGNKARARLAAMARNMPRPSPVRRPVPQGA
jgi:peptidoglycan/LPS O-acetylase OafA/YrhL